MKYNLTKLIGDMRIAIKETNVRLDFFIGPGLELVPSDMVFIEDSPGHNNTLLIASESQKFGSNANVNSEKKAHLKTSTNSPASAPSSKLQRVSQEESKSTGKSTGKSTTDTSNENLEIIAGSAILALIGRLAGLAGLVLSRGPYRSLQAVK